MMIGRGMGADEATVSPTATQSRIWDLPISTMVREGTVWTAIPWGVTTFQSDEGTKKKQFCFLGSVTSDPLIPGVCNTTALVMGLGLIGVLALVMNR